ncbi:NAD(P)H-dependent glycerol-3-phosphate dehydrogenase [Leptolyngbya sp. FACHB-17]|uniref:NAD(P)H-dependent glycerol-3-phosphate dehydrogenase n=1 Tax=unclassified Leptolyngbya TaxID=2650499 RepID=UPI0016812E40|nr:NAD(P)H-dependent glycerol-3-phosphate dehydrogenase [Leptolyngbya sp. FACHB-17]MBD2082457.1 NAD(P)H-dependent glycerol-3-phosphate dehydrogenase [Leptolyngbya sp. FACHB-17]
MRITVIGAGAWGSTLAGLVRDNGHEVAAWSRQSDRSLDETIAQSDLVISAVSMKGVRSVIKQISITMPTIVTATKGLDSESGSETALPLLPSQVWQAAFPESTIAVLSGPNLSKEIQQGLPAASVVASRDQAVADRVQQAFSSARFRVYTNADPLGVELGGTLKNVIAIAVGACDGLQLGANAKSALVTRGLAEMIRLGTYWGAKPETFYGLSGLGDLLATCSSSLSRNYQVGYGLAQGKTLSEVLATLEGTAEGINTTQVLIKLAQAQGISMPISTQVDRLLRGEITPQSAVGELMQRDSKPETV